MFRHKYVSVEDTLLGELGAACKGLAATFCMGGSFTLPGSEPQGEGGNGQGIRLWFTDKQDGSVPAESIMLPAAADSAAVASLQAACHPAKFGKGHETVLDESYRKALALPHGQFAIDLPLMQQGVLRTVQQVMMPGVQCTISAELDKLNVYRAGDFFKRHVDTPSSSSLLGTLVVCLPVPHAGGGLAVSHDGRRAVFDWGAGAARGEVQWAAFFSNCHHEVLPVTEGARLTVTYNLMAHKGGHVPMGAAVAPALHQMLHKLLSNPAFLTNGGVLGFPCRHVYAHSTPEFGTNFEHMLKGEDAALLATARALGLPVTARRVWRRDGRDTKFRANFPDADLPKDDAGDSYSEGGSRDAQKDTYWSSSEEDTYRELPINAVLTSSFGRLYLDEDGLPDDDDGREAFMEKVGATWDKRIIWVGGGLKSFIDWQCGGSMTFWAGNDGCEQDLFYCAAAIVVNVPPFAKRAAALPADAAGLSTAVDVSGSK